MRRSRTKWILIWLLLMAAMLHTGWSKTTDWMQCNQYLPGCNCKTFDGRKQAECINLGFSTIPDALSEEIQVLRFDNNNVHVLKREAFLIAGLVNLQKIIMPNCSIMDVDKAAFANLALVITIDLSNNEIKRLDPMTFRGTERLRQVNLNNNLIQRLDDRLFWNLSYLQKVELNDNRITHISNYAFFELQTLSVVTLKNNQLKTVPATIFNHLNKLNYLELQNNPWRCDCQLREFFEYTGNVSVSQPTYCAEPEYMRNQSWATLKPERFACQPDILWPDSELGIIEENGDELTLSCQVNGDPKPETYWTFSGRTLINGTVAGPSASDRKYTTFESGGTTVWSNVTISKLSHQDKGIYTCVARNAAGLVEKRVQVNVLTGAGWFGVPQNNVGDVWVLLLCLIVGLVCALVFILFMCFVCCRRGENFIAKKPQNNTITTNGDVTHHIIMEPEQQKTLLTAVNPVQKPPRKYDSSPQSENGGTELTELNRNLLDDNSVQAGMSVAGDSMEDRRSTNSLEQLSSCNSQDNLLLHDRPRIVSRSHHPPDLLAFSSRRLQQASPANSLVSNDGGDYGTVSRFRHLNSPIRSPVYQHHLHQPPQHLHEQIYSPSYETLGSIYSRTQSPFSTSSVGGGGSSAITPIVSHRQGYVTIPRRPRVPSWSSALTPTFDEAAAIAATFKTEPLYDNLGPRTTADGSSVLSLTRKVAAESPTPGTNIRTRPLPPAPLYTSHTLPHKSKLNHVFLSIRENEEPHFHPVVREPTSSGSGGGGGSDSGAGSGGVGTSGGSSSGVIKPLPLQFLPPSSDAVGPRIGSRIVTSTPDKRRSSWATPKQTPERGTLRKPPVTPFDSEGDLLSASPLPTKSLTGANSSGSGGGGSTGSGSKPKVPPKPPPKPKKSGPLFEDEGEDGTEV